MNARSLGVALLTVLMLTGMQGAGLVSGQATPTEETVDAVELPTGRPVSMSPDGTMVVSVEQREQICVYQVESMAEVSCASLDAIPVPIALRDVSWSPDSSRIVFALDAFRLMRDSDIWVMDVQSAQLTNLTEDNFDESLFPGDEGTNFFVDVAPAWTPDGQEITFSRSYWIDGQIAGNVIAQVPAAGGDAATLARLDPGRPGIMYVPGAWAPDGSAFYFTADYLPVDPLQSGIWALDPATGNTRQIAHTEDPELGLLMLRMVSPAGDRLLAYYPHAVDRGLVSEPLQRFVDPHTGEISPIPNPGPESESYEGSWFSTFSPDGQYLLQPWGPDGLFDFWVTNLETGESTQVATGLQSATPVDHWLSPVWGSNGLAGVAHDVTGFYSFPIEGLGLDLVPPTSEVVATETPAIPSPVPDSSTGTPAGGPVRSVETPDGRAVAMSPDGTYLAVVVPPQGSLCIYAVETMAEVSCADLSVLNTMLRIEDVVWSPDSTMIAFSEQAFITFEDGDLWVMDATTGTLTNLTDDGFDGNLLSQDDEDITFWIDVAPAWTPDSQFITFSRSEFENSQHVGNVVAQVPAAGGAIETLAEITDEAPGVWYYRGEWSPDGTRLYYSVTYQDPENPDNGIWVYDAGTGTTALLAVSADPEELGPLVLSQVSSDGTRLLAWYPVAVQAYPYLGRSPLTFVDAATGELSAVPDPAPESELFEGTWIATLSPDGQYLLQAVGLDAGATDFWVTNLATGESTQVASDLEDAVPVYYGLTPVWGTNGTVFVSWNVIGAHFFPIEGAGLSGGATPAESTPETSSASGLTGLSTESEMVTNGITPVFAMPDPEATVVTFLPPGHTVHLLAGPVTNAAGMWYPMYDPDSQVIGYIQASRLEPTE